MIASRKLLDAAALVEHAIRNADTTESKCEVCGMVHKRNWVESQGSKELGSIIRKLRNWANRIDEKGDGHEA